MQLTFIDWFAGIGGFRAGMEAAGHQCVGFCEFDKYAVMSYTSMHLITDKQREYLMTLPLKQRQKEILKEEYRNGEWFANDVRFVRGGDIPKSDCWCFGFPCQDISIAGKQLGFKGSRSSLFFTITKLIKELEEEDRPEWLFIENVKNLLSVNRGLDFARVLSELAYECGYEYIEYRLLNTKDFGIPQNRERVFIIAKRTGRKSGREILPIKSTNGENNVHKLESENMIQPCLTPARAEKRQNGRRFKEDGEPMFTLTAQDIHGIKIYDGFNNKLKADQSCTGALTTMCGQGGYRKGQAIIESEDKSIKKGTIIDDRFNNYREPRIYNNFSPTIACGSAKDFKVCEDE